MEVICFGLGMIIGGTLFGVPAFFMGKQSIKGAKAALEAEKNEYHRVTKQFSNFLNYDGTSAGQEEID